MHGIAWFPLTSLIVVCENAVCASPDTVAKRLKLLVLCNSQYNGNRFAGLVNNDRLVLRLFKILVKEILKVSCIDLHGRAP